jgi:hypothetical protein
MDLVDVRFELLLQATILILKLVNVLLHLQFQIFGTMLWLKLYNLFVKLANNVLLALVFFVFEVSVLLVEFVVILMKLSYHGVLLVHYNLIVPNDVVELLHRLVFTRQDLIHILGGVLALIRLEPFHWRAIGAECCHCWCSRSDSQIFIIALRGPIPRAKSISSLI